MKRFLRDGYKTAKEDPSRLHYEPWELREQEIKLKILEVSAYGVVLCIFFTKKIHHVFRIYVLKHNILQRTFVFLLLQKKFYRLGLVFSEKEVEKSLKISTRAYKKTSHTT